MGKWAKIYIVHQKMAPHHIFSLLPCYWVPFTIKHLYLYTFIQLTIYIFTPFLFDMYIFTSLNYNSTGCPFYTLLYIFVPLSFNYLHLRHKFKLQM